jgi:AcrR family transcriptional regulator
MARKSDPGARDCILGIASRLFIERGVHAVGLQQIIDECACGKNVLYREFGSKDELVVAFLERCRQDWARIIAAATDAHPGAPGDQLVAIVDGTARVSLEEGFRGCPLRNAYSEFPDPAHPAHQVIVAHYTERQASLRELACRAHARDPDALADRIALIIDGINANSPVLGKNGAGGSAVSFAGEAVKAALCSSY